MSAPYAGHVLPGQGTAAERLTVFGAAGFEGITVVGVPRTMTDGQGCGVTDTDALSMFGGLVGHRGVILIPTRADEQGRFDFKCAPESTVGLIDWLIQVYTHGYKNADYADEMAALGALATGPQTGYGGNVIAFPS